MKSCRTLESLEITAGISTQAGSDDVKPLNLASLLLDSVSIAPNFSKVERMGQTR